MSDAGSHRATPQTATSPTTTTTTPTPREWMAVWIDRGLMLVILLACALCVSHHNADPDLWGHVRYGMDLLAEGLPSVNTFSYNAANHPWINHELISELLMALGMIHLGPSNMLIVKCVMGVAAFALMFRFARSDGVNQFVAAATLLLAAVNLMHFWVMRPQLFSYFLFALLIGGLQWIFTGWRNRNLLSLNECHEVSEQWRSRRRHWLWLAPPLFMVWTNTHGAFAAGLAIFIAYLGLRSLEAYWMGRADRHRLAMEHAMVVLFSLAATLWNPYGYRFHQWMFESLGSPRPEITEWLPPEWNLVWLPFWVLVAVVGGAWLFGGRRDATHTVILALVLSQALQHRRHIAFFAILCGYWLAPVLAAAAARIRIGVDRETFGQGLDAEKRPLFGLALAFCASMLAVSLSGQFEMITVKRNQYPVAAFEFIGQRQLKGKLVTRFMWAQYAVYAFGADSPEQGIQIAFDGRFRTCYPQRIVDMYFDFAVGDDGTWPRHRGADSPPAEPSLILRHNQPDLVLLDRKQKHAVRTMHSNRDGWTLLYRDDLAELWGRSTRYADPNSSDYIPPEHRPLTDAPQLGMTAWPAAPPLQSGHSRHSALAQRTN